MERSWYGPRVDASYGNRRKFGCISLPLRRLDSPHLSLPYSVGPNLSVTKDLPAEITSFWTEALGSTEIDAIKDAPLWITATSSTVNYNIVDDENRRLLDEAYWFLCAFLVSGSTEFVDEQFMLSGATSDRGGEIRQVSRLDPSLFGAGMQSDVVADRRIASAALIHSHLRPLYETRTHPRLKRALHSFEDATKQRHLSQRLHDFVRSIDGLFDLPRGRSRKAFVKRSVMICGDSFEKDAGLLYDLRSVDEHLHPLHTAFSTSNAREVLYSVHRLTAVAEILSRELFVRVLTNAPLLANYEQDASIESMWAEEPPALDVTTGRKVIHFPL